MTEIELKRKMLNRLIIEKDFNLSDNDVIVECRKLEDYIKKIRLLNKNQF